MLRNITILAVLIAVAALATLAQLPTTRRAPEADWRVVWGLFERELIGEGLEKATELAKRAPGDPRLWQTVVYQIGRSPRNLAAVEAAAPKLLKVLQEAYRRQPDPDIAMNLLKIWQAFAMEKIVEIVDNQFEDTVWKICQSEKLTPELLVAVSECRRTQDRLQPALDTLDKAEELSAAVKGSEWIQLQIARERASILMEKEGRDSQAAAAASRRVVLLDDEFSSSSNRALCHLGSFALSKGEVEQAKLYLALGARVQVDHVLRSFGYEKRLALEMIRQGHVDAAIAYLLVAHDNEELENPETLYGLGLAYVKKQQKDEAAKWLGMYLKHPSTYKPREPMVRAMLKALAKEPASKQRDTDQPAATQKKQPD